MRATVLLALLLGCASSEATKPGDAPPPAPSTPPAATELTDGMQLTASGERYARTGFTYTPGVSKAFADPPAFVEGWSVHFDHVLVVLDGVWIQSEAVVPVGRGADSYVVTARVVDLVRGGSVVGKSGDPDDRVVAIASVPESRLPKNDGGRYGLAFDVGPAAKDAHHEQVNLDATASALYAKAVERGWSMVYAGTAEYQGPPPEAGSVFAKIPKRVQFTLGLATPVRFANCRNSDLPLEGDERPRGIEHAPGTVTTAQLTFHLDHLFSSRAGYDGAALLFDAIAANARDDGTVTIDDLENVDPAAVTTRSGEPLPMRSAVSDFPVPAGKQVAYETNGASLGHPKSLASYLRLAAATSGHLNAFGACDVVLNGVP